MYRIIDKRGSGKTSRLMLLAKEHNGVIVCANPTAMKNKALGYGLTGFDVISFEDYFTNIGEYMGKNVFIDELEYLLKLMGNIKGYTLSEEE